MRDKYPDGAELTIAELLRYTICESDGSTSDVPMKLIGGPGSVMAFLGEIQVPSRLLTLRRKSAGKCCCLQHEITYILFQPATEADSFAPTNPTIQPFRCANSELVVLVLNRSLGISGIGDLRSLKIQKACIPNHDDVEEECLDPPLAISSSIGSFLINSHRRTSRCNIRITFLLRTA